MFGSLDPEETWGETHGTLTVCRATLAAGNQKSTETSEDITEPRRRFDDVSELRESTSQAILTPEF
jgi:hypothetical protein